MVRYRRSRLNGGRYFFTVNLHNRRSHLLTAYIQQFRQALHKAKIKYPFTIDAIVVLPDHWHGLFKLPDKEHDYSLRIRMIKTYFVQFLKQQGLSINKNTRHRTNIWQARFWEHTIKDDYDWRVHIDYIHYNPVKHGWVDVVKDWPYSSFHYYVEKGILPHYWGNVKEFSSDV